MVANKAVLVYPEFDSQNTFWSYSTSLTMYAPVGEFGLPKRLLPPLGLMGLYNHLKPFYRSLSLIDKNIDPRPLKELIHDADHVYIGGMLAQEQSILKLAKQVKQAGKVLIVGGTVVTPESSLISIADHLVENEAEGIINELLQGLKTTSAKKYYKGHIVSAEHFFQPDYASINMQNYMHMAVQVSRGCPENCEFCDIPMRFGKAYRVTPFEKTAESFRQMKQLGWTGQVFIVDDNFIANPRKALEVLKQLYEIGEQIDYHHPKYTELTLRLADDSAIMSELRHWFHKAHFINGFYGVETPNKASLIETKKNQNLRGSRSLVDKLRFISEQTGAGVMMGMIYGFDHDTDRSVDEFIDFVNATHAPIVMAGLLNVLPLTGLMTRLEKEGRTIQATSGNNSDGVINFIPNHVSIKQAEQNYLRILQAIYHPDAYFKRVLRHLVLIDPNLQSRYRDGNNQLQYLIKVLTKKNAFIYWKYLPQAIAIAKQKSTDNKSNFNSILAEYFSLCAQYTHFSAQVQIQKTQISQRKYSNKQRLSWQQIKQSSEVTS